MTVSTEHTRGIPAGIKREVRQRCGFACIVCGSPIVEYHHMTPWSQVHEHTADNITLLCPSDHSDATGPRPTWNEAAIRAKNARPFMSVNNSTRYRPTPYGPQSPELRLGSNTIYPLPGHSAPVLQVAGRNVFSVRVEDGHALVSIELWSADGATIFRMVDNEWTYQLGEWDYKYEGNRLVIWEEIGHFLLMVRFDAPTAVTVERARFYAGNGLWEVTASGALIDRTHRISQERISYANMRQPLQLFDGGFNVPGLWGTPVDDGMNRQERRARARNEKRS